MTDPMAELAQQVAAQNANFPIGGFPDEVPSLEAEASWDTAMETQSTPSAQAEVNTESTQSSFYKRFLPSGD